MTEQLYEVNHANIWTIFKATEPIQILPVSSGPGLSNSRSLYSVTSPLLGMSMISNFC